MNASLPIDISLNPLSFSGSLLSLSRLGASGLDANLVSHCRVGGNPLFTLHPDVTSNTTVMATSSLLQWVNGNEIIIEATFQNERCLRFRGTAPLAFKASSGDFMWERPMFQDSLRAVEYSFEPIKNHVFVVLNGNVTTETFNQLLFNIQRDQSGGKWDLLFCEVETDTIASSQDVSWENAVADAQSVDFLAKVTGNDAVFNGFTDKLCPWSVSNHTVAERLASFVEWSCTVRAGGRFTQDVVLISKN